MSGGMWLQIPRADGNKNRCFEKSIMLMCFSPLGRRCLFVFSSKHVPFSKKHVYCCFGVCFSFISRICVFFETGTGFDPGRTIGGISGINQNSIHTTNTFQIAIGPEGTRKIEKKSTKTSKTNSPKKLKKVPEAK